MAATPDLRLAALFEELMRLEVDTNVVAVCEIVDRAVQSVVRVDACYYCDWLPDVERFYFHYNREGRTLDVPDYFPLGKGPTSEVIRTQECVWVDDAQSLRVHRSGITFGDPGVRNESAVHLPIRDLLRFPEIVGVLSFQARAGGAYPKSLRASFEYVSHAMASALLRRSVAREADRLYRAAVADEVRRACLNATVATSDRLLREIRRETQAAIGEVVACAGDLGSETPLDLVSICSQSIWGIEVHASRTTAELIQRVRETGRFVPEEAARRVDLGSDGARLLRLVAIGLKNAAIAERLGVSPKTIDKRLARLREALGIAGSYRQELIDHYVRYRRT